MNKPDPPAILARRRRAPRVAPPPLDVLDETLRALRDNEVDALFVGGNGTRQLFTLAGAERAYRVLIEEMGDGALTLTDDGVVLYANRHFADLLGRPLEQVIGSNVAEAFAPESRAALAAVLAQARLTKSRLELDLLDGAGARMPTLLSVTALPADALPGALCMVVTDLRWQRRSEAATQAHQRLQTSFEQQRIAADNLQASLTQVRLRESALNAISQGVLIADATGSITYMNPACERISGYNVADLQGQSARLLQGLGTNAETSLSLHAALDAAGTFHGEILNHRKDGTPFWNELSVTPVPDESGVAAQFVGVMRDVTARRAAQAQLMLASQLFDQSSEGFIVTDAQCSIVKVNRAFTAICGYSEAEALGQNPRMLASGRHDAAFFADVWAQVEQAGRWQGEIWNRRKDGSVYPQWLCMTRITDVAGQLTHYIAAFSDITQRKQAEDSIRQLAHFDPLTGLPNRALLLDRATHALQMARRSNEPMALMFIDLDHFKNVNDSLGHDVGDRLLIGLAARFKAALRDQDTLSRMGGDEFVLLLPGTDASGAAHVAQKLVQLTQAPHQIENHELTITPSIGIALYPGDATSYDALAKCADAAMYRAKQGGRNGFRFYTAEIQAQSARALLLENALRRALERNQLELHYQPQTSLHDGHIVGAEALLRWRHPELGWVKPDEFIPIAESSGLIAGIGEWVLRSAVHQLKRWTDMGMPPITVSVNLSTVQFRHPSLLELVSRTLGEAGVEAGGLELELTESVAAEDPENAVAVMLRLRECGVRMSIDDFGTGYSSLAYLKRFKVDKLKIDQSFVCGLTDDPQDQAIVCAIIKLAGSLGLRTIAEGVETVAQMDFLQSHGCDEMQGYLLSPAMPAEAFTAWVNQRAAEQTARLVN